MGLSAPIIKNKRRVMITITTTEDISSGIVGSE